MNRRDFLKAAGITFSTASMPKILAAQTNTPNKPNIIFIMVDDLGKEWISCYGAEDVKTPNIDALAQTGMRFENAYSMPQCTPTRATLLTGQYPWRTGWVNHWDVPRWGVGYFDWKQRRNMTFARIMKTAGYATAAAGKWQINDFRITPDFMRKHGFDDWCMWTGFEGGKVASGKRYWDAYINTPQDGSKTYAGKFGPDIYTDYLIRFMADHKDQPMVLYFPMALTHGPLTTTPAEPNVADKLEKHKSMVRYTDQLVGRLVESLEKLGIRDRTIVIFTTDNGTGGKTGTRNGREVPGGKAKKTENGVCAPFIVNCPALVPQGVVTYALTDFTDLLPTFAELGGAEVPADLQIDGVSIAPLLLGEAADSPRRWIMALGHGAGRLDEAGVRGKADYTARVIRDKQYKVWVNEQRKIDKLYDLLADPFEENNLIGSRKSEHLAAIEKFQAVVDTTPETDARPGYEPREPNPWDKKL